MKPQTIDKSFGKRTVLVVEDDELNREMLAAMLEDDYKVLQAENGHVGLEILQYRYREISLVVLDVQMPVMNGYEFLEEVKKDPLLNAIPVIVATGSNRYDEEEYCLDLGASDFVTKPYNRHVVQLRIANIINLKESASTLSEIEYDDLTGIYTLQAFIHHAELMLRLNPDVEYDLIISDIEDFGSIVRNYGQNVANQVLKTNAHALIKNNNSDAVYGRYGDDQFVSMYPHSVYHSKPFDAISLDASTPTGTVHIDCKIKFGIKRFLNHDVSVREHCNHAKMALNTIKHVYGRNIAVFDPQMQAAVDRRTIIENTMQQALKENQFLAYYQPKHSVTTGELVGAECLIRWIHPSFGFMSPSEFVPIFEQTGFVSEADLYIWKRTCDNIRKWQDAGLSVVPISVNCSRIGFLQDHFIDKWLKPVNDSNISTDLLHLEITESLFSNQIDALRNILKNCREKGISIELDDFGTGYSSLSILEQLPLDVVKLDMSFIQNLHEAEGNMVMPAIVNLIHNLGMKIVAEGVETDEQLQYSKEMGIDTVQGYYYSKPMPEDDFMDYLKNHNIHKHF